MNDVEIVTNAAAQAQGTFSSSKPSFRLSDVRKLLKGRYGGACRTSDAERYLMAVIPELMPQGRSWKYAVAWAREWAPVLLEERGEEFVRQCWTKVAARKRRHLTTDQLARLLKVADDEPARLNLRCIPAASRTKKVRVAERKAMKAKCEAARRARKPGYTPRSESLAVKEPWKAESISKSTWYSRRRAERLAAVMPELESADLHRLVDTVSDTPTCTDSWTSDPLHPLRHLAHQTREGCSIQDNDNLSRDTLAA